MRASPRLATLIEILENRIAPAAVFQYTDLDGDKVTIKTSAGTSEHLAMAATIAGGQLQLLDLSAATWGQEFAGTTVTFSVTKVPTGDGQAHVGRLNATGIDLGAVTIKGDLGQIDAGDAEAATPAIKSLTVRSMGRFGLDTQGAAGSLSSDIVGALPKLAVAGDVVGAFIDVVGGASAKIGSVTIGGSLVGQNGVNSGQISAEGDIGSVKIRGDLEGGANTSSGRIFSSGKILSVQIGGAIMGGPAESSGQIQGMLGVGSVKVVGDVVGSSGAQSGAIVATTGSVGSVTIGGSLAGGKAPFSGLIGATLGIGAVKIGRNIVGGPTSQSGSVFSAAGIGSVAVGGSVLGGDSSFAGSIDAGGDVGSVKIGGSLIGRSLGPGEMSIQAGALISSTARIGSITIGGSVLAGEDASAAGDIQFSPLISAGRDIGSLKVGGSISGSRGPGGTVSVFISAVGQLVPGATQDLAIGQITVGGRVEFTNILAGYAYTRISTDGPVNGDASIGSVKVKGDWVASNLVAGAEGGGDGVFGTADDVLIAGGVAGIAARIASVTIGGTVVGTPDAISAIDGFGFVAQQIGVFKASGFTATLSLTETDQFIPLSLATGDVKLREI